MRQSRKRLANVVLTSLTACAAMFAVAAPAQAGVSLSVTPDIIPNPVLVGGNDLAANLRIANASTGTDAPGTATLSRIQLTMACGDQGDAVGVCTTPDPGVFVPSATALGVAGSCVGTNFTLALDPVGGVAAGRYLFAPTGGPVTRARWAVRPTSARSRSPSTL